MTATTREELGPEPILPASSVDTKVWSDYWRDTAVWNRRRSDIAERKRDELQQVLQSVMAQLADYLDEDHFSNIESMVADKVPYPPEIAVLQRERDEARELLREVIERTGEISVHWEECFDSPTCVCGLDILRARVAKVLNTETKGDRK